MQITDFAATLKQYGIRRGAGVPCSYFKPLVNHMASDPEMDYVSSASEGEAVAISAGMVTAGRPAFTLMQNSGLGNAVNPVTSLLNIYQIPTVLLVSHRGEPGRPDEPQHLIMGQITEELARLCALETFVFDEERFIGELAEVTERGVPGAWVIRKGRLTGGPSAPAFSLKLQTGAISLPPRAEFRPQHKREALLELTLPLINKGEESPAVIATTGKLSRELYELDDGDHSKENRFYMVGSLGCASSYGLGIALAQPERPVVVLDGDGGVLMKMGTLATVGTTAPKNFHHVVFDNGAHESTGGHATSSPNVDFATVALACGYRSVATVSDGAEYAETLKAQLDGPGPSLVRVAVELGSRKDLGRPKLSPRDAYLRFRGFLTRKAV